DGRGDDLPTRVDAHDPASRLVHQRPQAQGASRLPAARASLAVPGGSPDQPRARWASDRPPQPLARAVPAGVGGRPPGERAERAGVQRPAVAGGRPAARVRAQAQGWLIRRSIPATTIRQLSGRADFLLPMFYVRYLRNELVRRRSRTILTLLGLGLGVALVIAISSVSSGLDRAQHKTLDPLAGIGTDLTVTLTPSQDQGAGFAGPGGGSGGGGNRDLIRANQSVITDLSKLGKPGQHFVHDFFLPGTQLTFQQTAAQQIASISGVAQVTTGLTLLAEHQEGIVPKIVAKLKTGGQTLQINRQLPRPTAAQFQKTQ